MKIIPVKSSKGILECMVDDEDHDWAMSNFWFDAFARNDYISIKVTNKSTREKTSLARAILENHGLLVNDKFVDHVNRNGLDNQKSNLRNCSSRQNSQNRTKVSSKECTSIYKGVCAVRTFRAVISLDGRSINLGGYDTEREAAIAYDVRAKELFNDFATPNITDATEEEIEKVKKMIKKVARPDKVNCTSKYKGVFFKKCKNKWQAVISVDKKQKHLGTFENEIDAAKAYNEAAVHYFGDTAIVNEGLA